MCRLSLCLVLNVLLDLIEVSRHILLRGGVQGLLGPSTTQSFLPEVIEVPFSDLIRGLTPVLLLLVLDLVVIFLGRLGCDALFQDCNSCLICRLLLHQHITSSHIEIGVNAANLLRTLCEQISGI